MSEIYTKSWVSRISTDWTFLIPETTIEIIALLECSDYYLAHPPKQPKAEIAEYVESQGFLVPRRFSSFEEAVEDSNKFIMRTEHPQDYTGQSDLFQWDILKSEDFKNDMFGGIWMNIEADLYAQQVYNNRALDTYCKVHNIDKRNFLEWFSNSYWEYIEGDNYTVVEDDVIDWVLHIYWPHPLKEYLSRYMRVENGEIIEDSLDGEDVPEIDDMIAMYTWIKELDKFDPQHRPIMEFQIWQDKMPYFLQYHRCKNKSNTQSFNITRELEEGEIESNFVRWCTPDEWVIFNARSWLGSFIWDDWWINRGDLYSIIYSKKYIIASDVHSGLKNINGLHFNVTIGHKSDVIIGIPKNICVWEYELRIIINKFIFAGIGDVNFPVRIISDGRKAYVKVLISEQEITELLMKHNLEY